MNAKEAYEEFENQLFDERSGCMRNHRENELTHYGAWLCFYGVWLRFCGRRALEAVGETATAEQFDAALKAEMEASVP